MALLHEGRLRHAARPIREGARHNLIVWLFGKGGDVRVATYPEDERLTAAARWGRAEEELPAAAGLKFEL